MSCLLLPAPLVYCCAQARGNCCAEGQHELLLPGHCSWARCLDAGQFGADDMRCMVLVHSMPANHSGVSPGAKRAADGPEDVTLENPFEFSGAEIPEKWGKIIICKSPSPF